MPRLTAEQRSADIQRAGTTPPPPPADLSPTEQALWRDIAATKPADVWKDYAIDIRDAQALPCGHYLSEEAPEETYRAMRDFFKS